MKAYINRADKIADGQFDDKLACARITKVRCRSNLKKRILRGFKKSMRQKVRQKARNDMTSEERQEAIAQLERISGNLASIGETVDYTEFAIEALKAEPCEDCVSRQAVNIALLKKGQSSKRYKLGETWELNGSEIREAIAGVSSVYPQPKTGHWIHFAASDDCSECGWSTGKYISPSKYCPNCGADMRGEEE